MNLPHAKGDGEFAPWQFCTRFDIPDRADPTRTYLTRWRIFQCPWFALYLHRINLPDADEHMHDHPWNFASIVLRGGYDELVRTRAHWPPSKTGQYGRRRGWLSVGFTGIDTAHKIVRLYRSPTWTLVLTGRRVKTWGFFTDEGFVRYREYLAARDTQQITASRDAQPAPTGAQPDRQKEDQTCS